MTSSRNRGNLREALASKTETLLKRPAATPPTAVAAVTALVGPAGAEATAVDAADSVPAVAAAAPVPAIAATAPSNSVQLPSALLISDVRAFATTLREAAQHGDVLVDPSRLGDVDTAGLQLLCASRIAVLASGRQFRWSAESRVLTTAALATGLAQALGLAA
jgi:anti-anti-sigma regulatory factor